MIFLLLKGNSVGKSLAGVKLCWIREGEGESKVVDPVSLPWLFVTHSLITPCLTYFTGGLNFLWMLWDRNRQTLVDKLMGTYDVAQAEGGDYDAQCKKEGHFFAHSGPLRAHQGSNHLVCPQGSQVPLAGMITRMKGNVLDVVIP